MLCDYSVISSTRLHLSSNGQTYFSSFYSLCLHSFSESALVVAYQYYYGVIKKNHRDLYIIAFSNICVWLHGDEKRITSYK